LLSDGVETSGGCLERGLRILHVLPGFGYGTASTLTEIIPSLKREGATVEAVVLDYYGLGDAAACGKMNEVGVAFQEISLSKIHRWMHPRPLFRIRDLARIANRLGDTEADVIHCHGMLALAATLLSRHKAPVVTTFHGLTNRWSASQRCYRAAMGLADAVVALKAADIRAIQMWSRTDRVYLAKNCVDVSRWQRKLSTSTALRDVLGIPPDAFIVGLLGRLSKEKGFEPFLVSAARSMLTARGDGHVVVAGKGSEEKRLKRMIKQQSLTDRVHFLGYRHNMEDVYRTLDALAVPSDTETQPMVVLEAMACGVPVATFSVGALPEMLADGAGIVVPRGDFDVLVDALDDLRTSGTEQASLVETAHKRVRDKYDACTVARDLIQEVYLPLVS